MRLGTCLAALLTVIVGVGGCTVEERPVTPELWPSAVPSAAPATPSRSAAPTPTWIPDPAVRPCVPPAAEVMAWLRLHGSHDLPEDGVTMVYVGPGNHPLEDWWIVAVQSYENLQRSDVTYLTNEPGLAKPSGEFWIKVGYARTGDPSFTDWSSVNWPPEKLVVGQAAQQQALRCLGSPNAKTP